MAVRNGSFSGRMWPTTATVNSFSGVAGLAGAGGRGLVDDTGLLVQRRSEFVQALALQHHQTGRQPQGLPRVVVHVNVAVEVGSGQHHHYRLAGVQFVEPPDGVVTAPGMQRDQQVAALTFVAVQGRDPMSRRPQDSRPPVARDAVARAPGGSGRGDQRDSGRFGVLPYQVVSKSSGNADHFHRPAWRPSTSVRWRSAMPVLSLSKGSGRTVVRSLSRSSSA